LRGLGLQIAVARIELLKVVRIVPEQVLLLLPSARHIVIVGDLTLGSIYG